MSDFIPTIKEDEIQEGQGVPIEINGLKLALFLVNGIYYCIDELCTHAQVSLCEGEICGNEVLCPLHMASFSLITGEATAPPAYDPVQTYETRVTNGIIEIKINN